ncbi:MAG: SDR family oxidoreductase [Proteobacteria bacterium]|nr:SDR family oxidoreductase [Pseudomonadota bacterium]
MASAEPVNAARRWAIVTGGSVRGGLAISRRLHARGLGVVVHHGSAASAARAQAVVDELNARVPGSARRWEAALQAHPAFPDATLDVAHVVCNASRLAPSECGDMDAAELDFRIHVSGHAALLASVEPSLRRLRGSVVAVGDLQTQQPNRDHVWYLVAKAGLETLMRTLAVQWAPEVRCNVVAPGALAWHAGWSDEPRRAAILQSIPLARIGSFDELADCVAWLALDAGYVNGQVLKMDGGRSAWLP